MVGYFCLLKIELWDIEAELLINRIKICFFNTRKVGSAIFEHLIYIYLPLSYDWFDLFVIFHNYIQR